MISHRSNFGKSKSPKTKPAVTFNMLPFVLTTLKIHQPQSNHFQKNFDESVGNASKVFLQATGTKAIPKPPTFIELLYLLQSSNSL